MPVRRNGNTSNTAAIRVDVHSTTRVDEQCVEGDGMTTRTRASVKCLSTEERQVCVRVRTLVNE